MELYHPTQELIAQVIFSRFLSVSNSAHLTMNSGVYIIEGGGFSVSGTGTVTGSGVVIFNVGSTYPTTGGT